MHEAGILRCCWTLLQCISPVHVAPPCGCILTVQLVAEFGLWFQLFCVHYFCFLFRDFALEACGWPSCDDFQCDQCHVGMDVIQRANHTDLPEGGGQVRHTSPDLRKTNRLSIFIQKMCCLLDGITIIKLHFIKGILLYHYSLLLYKTLM